MSVGLTIKILGTLVELAIPYILSVILDEAIPAAVEIGDTQGGLRQIFIWGALMVVCAVIALVFNIVANRMAARVARDTAIAIRHDLFDSTLRLSCSRADAFTVPSLESRLTSDTYNVHHLIGMIQRMGIRAPILLMGGLIITFTLDPVLAGIMACVLPFIALTVFLVSRKGVPLHKKAQESGDAMVRVVREDAQGIRVIKALSRKQYEQGRYEQVNRQLQHDGLRASVVMGISNPVINLFLNVGLVAVLLVGAIRVTNGECLPGKIISFIQYFTLLSNAMLAITRIFMMFTKGAASMGRITEVLDAAAAYDEAPKTVRTMPAPMGVNGEGYLRFENIRFTYGEREKDNRRPHLSGITFDLPKGGTLGLIGATGSGKTTLLSLLMRFYDVREGNGTVSLGGRDLRTMTPEELRQKFGIAMQNDFIFAGSIEDNIRFGREISHEDVVFAAKVAQAYDFISALPDGFDHQLTSKGTNLSGGQKQRLLIARALAGKPEILILDDASSALDYRTDAALRQDIRAAQVGDGDHSPLHHTTTIIVAQRVSSVKHADLILVLDGGEVIGSGNHDALMETCEVYREIAESQMGGAILD
ncbi:MAG: ABC transporter ATP-binding protein [Ruminococcaceae bacterium]|nr:ABC transporter ATP-binding protein [Oscillospiraceae bacterium]